MPYKAFKKGDEYCVYTMDNDDTPFGEPHGCHKTRKEALDQVKALYANANPTKEFDENADDLVKEFGDNPDLYAVAVNPDVPSTWKYPIFDYQDVSQTIETLTYGGYGDPVLLAEQREAAYNKINDRIDKLKIEENAKETLRSRLKYCMDYNNRVKELASVANEDITFTVVSEFKGEFPEIPFAEGVDVRELTSGDDDPLFVSLPVAEVGITSRNNLYYDDKLVSELEKQINVKRPNANFGHIKDDDRDTVFNVPAGIWVGAVREGKKLWAKAYIMPGEEKTYIKKLKAVGGSIATSIYGRGSIIQDKNGRNRAASFSLESLDFGSKDRVSLNINPQMVLTSEFTEKTTPKRDNKMSDNLDVKTLRKEDAPNLPQEVKDAVLAEFESAKEEMDRISELTKDLEHAAKTISEYENTIAEYRRKEFGSTLDAKIAELVKWETTSDKTKSKLEAFRSNLKDAVLAKIGDSTDIKKAERQITEFMDGYYGTIAETLRDEAAGPSATVAAGTKTEDWRKKYVDNAQEIARQSGAIR